MYVTYFYPQLLRVSLALGNIGEEPITKIIVDVNFSVGTFCLSTTQSTFLRQEDATERLYFFRPCQD